MLNATLTLTATPELLNTLNKIADAFSNTKAQANVTPTEKQKAEIGQVPQQQAPVYQAPVQQVVPGNIPAAYPQSAQQIQQQVPIQQQPITSPQPVQVQQPQGVPTTAQAYTLDQLALAGTQVIDAGHMAELQQLLASFGVQALTALPKEQYGAFATKLRALGAKI